MHKKLRWAVLFSALAWIGFVFTLCAYGSESAASGHRGTNITIDTNDLDPISLNEKTEAKEKKPVIYQDGRMSFDFNENSEPNINTRF